MRRLLFQVQMKKNRLRWKNQKKRLSLKLGRISEISFLERILEKILPSKSFMDKLSQVIHKLGNQSENLENAISKLKQRDQEILQRCVGAQATKDTSHAKIYANECVEIRKMLKLSISSQLALEKAIIRLERVAEFRDFIINLNPVTGILKEIENGISDFIPEVANGIEDVNSTLNSLSSEVSVPSVNVEDITSNEEAKKVLEESNILAEQRMKEQFPELPDFLAISKESKILEPVALTEGGQEVSLHERVYEYLKKRNGDLNIAQCASELGISPEDVKKEIDHLREEGKIAIK